MIPRRLFRPDVMRLQIVEMGVSDSNISIPTYESLKERV